jgi:hypothetical protein
VTSSLEKPLVSIAGAAGLLRCECWMVHVLIDLKVLSAHRVQGTLRIRHRELDALRRRRDPSYRSETSNGNA